ncbi:uncharacterized protein GIQ15_01336 [Arthroderma uncinatum]|uniref:uncharacterized protein n=1 Tax=Arthroderma uncinatum TaxID=74035 RepID=UPI00144A9669|nr:uncharacterized protein GIQ15_01336 [Arthroderma uncinatum]KAF3491819.1 hypothetical protein GIQ15_01336 [Arthroderma uncinatum]
MDPSSISTSAAALVAISAQVVRLIKTTIEKLKNSARQLLRLLNQVERVRLLLEQLRAFGRRLGDNSTLLLSFNDSTCRDTMADLRNFVHGIASSKGFLVGVSPMVNESKLSDLLRRLHRHEEEIQTLLMTMATGSTLRTEEEAIKISENALSRARATTAFESTDSQDVDSSENTRNMPQVWHGQCSRHKFDNDYRTERDRLSNAAYAGEWDELFEILKTAKRKYNESWVNCPRLRENTSGWTPLHQAVFMCADEDEIEALLELGALRTLRTIYADPDEFPYPDLTPIEMARYLSYTHMYSLLQPVIRHNIPDKSLDCLQQRFHDLILLTELEEPEMRFPVGSPDAVNPQGYIYRLDWRELLVKSYGITGPDESKQYRISEAGIDDIEEAIVFGG